MCSKTEVKTTAICCSCARCDLFSRSCCVSCCSCCYCCSCCSWSNCCCSLRKGLKQLKKKAISALCMCSASPHSAASPKSSSPVKPNPNPKPPLVVATLDSHRTEAVKACIEYINATSSSSMKLSTSASGSSSSSSTSSGPKSDSVPSK